MTEQSAAVDRVAVVARRLEARQACSEYDQVPVWELVDALGGTNEYALLLGEVRELAYAESADADIEYLLGEVERLRTLAVAAAEQAAGYREVLAYYGEHHGFCMQVNRTTWEVAGRPDPIPCTCGFEQAGQARTP